MSWRLISYFGLCLETYVLLADYFPLICNFEHFGLSENTWHFQILTLHYSFDLHSKSQILQICFLLVAIPSFHIDSSENR